MKRDCITRTVEALKSSEAGVEIVARDILLLYHEDSKEFATRPYIGPRNSFYPKASDCLVQNDLYTFAFAWQGIFKAVILNRYALRFTDRIFYEDHDFGAILFSLAGGLIHPNFAGLIYRQREGSIMSSYGQDAFPPAMPSHLEPLKPHFKNYKELRTYYRAYCACVIAGQIHRFMQQHGGLENELKEILEKSRKNYIHDYIYSYSHLNYLDPQGLLAEMGITDLEEYKRRDTRKTYWTRKYQQVRYCWRHPLRALKALRGAFSAGSKGANKSINRS